ncbi:hypothetical protein DFR70_108345 [Nocardia tenerifensis]|uniref:Uncharacterized protein n=1 Tax=Nocardia tenerifensis TaxID=228006 RepID=A0A318K0J8_9NOCA|nr:hypothetical protein [Nocardia tenerifensis]PXX61787.1 hypothetical protein DFR70_108345 [Nocardia tenerifensis]
MPRLRRMILGPDYTPERLREAITSAVHALANGPISDGWAGG